VTILKRLWRAETGIFLTLWLLLLVGGRSRLFRDPGTFWHTRLGQIMLERHELVRGDPFSFTASILFPNEKWIPHQWLGECLMALVHRCGEWDALLLAAATILAGLYTWIAHRLIVSGLHWSLASAIMVLSLAAGASHFHIRPHLATMIFFGLTFARLVDFEAGRTSLARLFWLVPAYVLWTNLHGGMVGGLMTMAVALIGWTASAWFGWTSPIDGRRKIILFIVLLLLCSLTAFANPYGWRLPSMWLEILHQGRLSTLIQEHAPLDPSKPEAIIVLLLMLVYLVVLVAAWSRRRPRVTWLLPLPWLYLGCAHVRHASLFGIAAGLALAEMIPATGWADRVVRKGSDLFDAARGNAARQLHALSFILPLAALITACLLQLTGSTVPVLGTGWAQFDASVCPVDAIGPLKEYPDGTPIFNELNFGGCLIYFAPNTRVFIDDRAELYGEDFLLEYDQARRMPAYQDRFLSRFHFNLVLTQADSEFDLFFKAPGAGWQLIGEGKTAHLYRRR
jgi:hypothetical protein